MTGDARATDITPTNDAQPALLRGEPTIALALGGGGAKGLAHIPVLEAFDDLGVRPVAVAGTSIGAILGAAYAAGISARDLRAHTLDVLGDRAEVLRRLFAVRAGRFADLLKGGLTNPVLIDAERFLDAFLPTGVPARFEDLAIPFTAVATDFHARVEVAFSAGPLIPAVGASIAIPGVLRPVLHQGRVLIDGGTTSPIPVDHVAADVTVAVDVMDGSAGGREIDVVIPDSFETMFGAVTLMMQTLSGYKLAAHRPTLHLRPPVAPFRVLDFFKAREILAAADPMREEAKHRIEAALAFRREG